MNTEPTNHLLSPRLLSPPVDKRSRVLFLELIDLEMRIRYAAWRIGIGCDVQNCMKPISDAASLVHDLAISIEQQVWVKEVGNPPRGGK